MSVLLRSGAATLVAAAWLVPVRAACPLQPGDGEVVTSGALSLAWRAEAGSPTVGQPFALRVSVCPAQARLVAVDATMPEHRHGMNYRPSLHPLGDGRWRVDGLLWHMAGRWEMRFDLRHADVAHTLRHSVVLR